MKETNPVQNSNSPYSHGLEETYRIETIDLKTVKKMAPISITSSPIETFAPIEALNSQLELYPAKVENLKLYEPISSLKFTPFTSKAILALGIKTIQELQEASQHPDAIKNLGRGHIDEVVGKLRSFLPTATQKHKIEFGSLVRTVLGDFDPKVKIVVAKEFEIIALLECTPQELNDAESLSTPNRKELFTKAMNYCRIKHAEFIRARFSEIIKETVIPWMETCHNLAKETEIKQLLAVCGESKLAIKVLNFFEEIIKPHTLFSDLVPVSNMLYSLDERTKELIVAVDAAAKHYFYSKNSVYPFSYLLKKIAFDLAKDWISFSEDALKKILLLSDTFTIWIDPSDEVMIQLK